MVALPDERLEHTPNTPLVIAVRIMKYQRVTRNTALFSGTMAHQPIEVNHVPDARSHVLSADRPH